MRGYAFYFVAIAVAFAAVFRHPKYAIYFIVPLLPLQNVRYWLHDFPLGPQLIDIMLVAAGLGLRRRGQSIFAKTPLNTVLFFYVLYTYISLWLGAALLDSELPLWFNNARLADWKNYMVMILLFFLVVGAIETRKDMIVLLVLMAGATLAIDKSVRTWVTGSDLSEFQDHLRYEGVMGFVGANGMGALQAQVFSFLLAFAAVYKRFSVRALSIAIALGSAWCVMYSYSRGAYLACGVGWLFVGLVKKRILLVALIAFLAVWQSLVPTSVDQRVSKTYDANGELEASAAERVRLWDDAMDLVASNPITGTGYNTYQYMGRVWIFQDTHNYFLKVLVETGIIGLLLYLSVLGAAVWAGLKLYRMTTETLLRSLGLGMAAWMLAAVVANVFGDRWTYVHVTGFTFTLLGCVVRGQMLARADSPEAGTEALDALEQDSVPATC